MDGQTLHCGFPQAGGGGGSDWRIVLQSGGQTVRDRCQHSDRLGAAASGDRQRSAGKMGGHKPKAIFGERRLWLLQRIKDRDFTFAGLLPNWPRAG